MLTFKGDPKTKAMLIERAIDHAEADRIMQGHYWANVGGDEWNGCAVGCLVTPVGDIGHAKTGLRVSPDEISSAKAYCTLEEDYGIPRALTGMADAVFESLPGGYYQRWPRRFIEALPVGVEFSVVKEKLRAYCKRTTFWEWHPGDAEPEEMSLGPEAANALLAFLRRLPTAPDAVLEQIESHGDAVDNG